MKRNCAYFTVTINIHPGPPERIPAKVCARRTLSHVGESYNAGYARTPRRVKSMSVSSIGTTTAAAYVQQTAATKTEKGTKETSSSKTNQDTAVVYEKGFSSSGKTNSTKSNAAIIAQLKADAEARTSQLQSLVEKMISKQGQTLGTADDMWSFLAKGNLKADPETIAQAKKDVAEDGYWGAEQTSDRILSFAKALSGDDPDKAEELLNAFKKGYSQATKSWGGNLPSLCSDTYDLVEKKFGEWMNSSSQDTQTD